MLGFWLICAGVAHADTEQVTGVIHIDALETGAQDLSIAEAVDLVARAGLGIAILTPHDNAVVKYGLLPFRNLLKMQVTQASIQEFGVQRYVDAVRATDEGIPEVITISGTEAIPAYYWEDVWGGQPVVRNLHKHLLVIGLSEPEDYADIPSMTNGFPFNPWCLLYLWPIAVILSGGFLMFQARRTTTADNTRSLKPGALLTIIGGLFFLNSVPFWPVYDQYHGDPGNGPYQAVVDYANARNAMTFWAHPEVTQRMSQPAPWQASILADSVVFETLPYTNALLETFGYTGFAIFEEGMLVVGKPGGIWDQTLIEYCAGVRSNPVWAIAEVDFEYSHIREGVGTSQTVFYLDKRNTAGVLDAMRHGAMYARRGAGCGLSVRDFRVSDPDGQAVATMGGHVTLTESPRIRIELDVENANIGDLQILVVRGGRPDSHHPRDRRYGHHVR